MLSIFSRASWLYVCLLWRNVYLGLLPIFWFFFFLYWAVWVVCIFWRLTLVCKYFLLFWVLSFYLILVSFTVQKLLNLIKSHLFIFVMIFITLGGGSKKILWFMSKCVLPIFSPKSFMVSGLTLRSLFHFEFIFLYGVRVF